MSLTKFISKEKSEENDRCYEDDLLPMKDIPLIFSESSSCEI